MVEYQIIGSPSTSLQEIHARQSVVAVLHSRPHLRADLSALLKSQSSDISRIVQRFILRKGTIEDLVAIKEAISLWTLIKERVELEVQHGTTGILYDDWKTFESLLLGRIKDMGQLEKYIKESVDECALQMTPEVRGNSNEGGDAEGEGFADVDRDPDAASVPGERFQRGFTIKPR